MQSPTSLGLGLTLVLLFFEFEKTVLSTFFCAQNYDGGQLGKETNISQMNVRKALNF